MTISSNASALSTYSEQNHTDYFICQVTGWNSWDGRTEKINIYLRDDIYQGRLYIGRNVYSNGDEGMLIATVHLITSPALRDDYKYSIKLGSVGRLCFNTTLINDSYIERDSNDVETFVCQVNSWNSWDGRVLTLNIYLCQTSYGSSYYNAREVNNDGSISQLSSTVKLVKNPKYSNYKYYTKAGFMGSDFFNTNLLDDRYID